MLVSSISKGQSEKDYILQGKQKLDSNEYSDAMSLFNKAIEINPNNSSAYAFRGNTKYELQDLRGALSDYNKAIKLDASNSEYNYRLGLTYHELNLVDNAMECYNNSITLNPQNSIVYYYRGIAFIDLNNIDAGCEDLSKAGELGYIKAYDLIKNKCNNNSNNRINQNALFKSTKRNSGYNNGGTGDGVGTGSGDGGGNGGGSGKGDGLGCDLVGRSIRSAPKVVDNSKETGIVVINITVDKNGNVVSANGPARGSTTTSANLVKKSKEAAEKVKFSPSDVEVQKGTMTFRYFLK